MRREIMKIPFILIAFLIAVPPLYGDEEEKYGDIDIPAGMKLQKEGDVGIIMPKDGILRRVKENILVMESTEEYTTRQILEMKSRLALMEARLKEQAGEIEHLKASLSRMKREKEKKR